MPVWRKGQQGKENGYEMRRARGGGGEGSGGDEVDAQKGFWASHHITTRSEVRGVQLTKIDADGTVVDLVSHIGEWGEGVIVRVREIGDDGGDGGMEGWRAGQNRNGNVRKIPFGRRLDFFLPAEWDIFLLGSR